MYSKIKDIAEKDPFVRGTGVISLVAGSTGEDRFYVMALEDYDSNWYTWYNNGYGILPEENNVSESTNDFGEGKAHTETERESECERSQVVQKIFPVIT